MIKLIASDLDGTLLKEGTMDINPEIYEIIRKLKAKGIVFAAVSGREYDSIIEKMAIPADVLKEVVEYVRAQEGASFMTAGSAQAYVERADQAFVKKLREGYKLHVNEVDDVLNAPETMTKVAMYNEKIDAAVGAEEAKKRFGEKIQIMASGDYCNDVSMLLEAGKSYAVTTAREEAKQAARYVLEKPGPDSVLNVLKMILEL